MSLKLRRPTLVLATITVAGDGSPVVTPEVSRSFEYVKGAGSLHLFL
jgi:hypothetical protein